jgi:precorrin-2 dehydrogenase / sirohydrochlorin ferrochelatase
MLPFVADLAKLPALLLGEGPQTARRLALLRAAGAEPKLFAPAPKPALLAAAGPVAIERRLPTPAEIAAARLLLVGDLVTAVDLPAFVAQARAARTLVHVEDRAELSDLTMPSLMRRGDLLIAVSTNGRSPTLAARMRQFLEDALPEEWAERVERIGALRDHLRARGMTPKAVRQRCEALIEAEQWLPPRPGTALEESGSEQLRRAVAFATPGRRHG